MRTTPQTPTRETHNTPDPVTGAILGALGLGVVGGITGLVLGLQTYAPTAWAAVVELGAPAAVVGAVGGGLVGLVRARRRRVSRP